MFYTKYKKIVSVLFALLLIGNFEVVLASTQLPEMMVGQTTVIDQLGYSTYGGMAGNYAIYNYDASINYGFNMTNTSLFRAGCVDQTFDSVNGLCFVLGTGLNGAGSAGINKTMSSRTSVDLGDGNGMKVVYEIPVLFTGGVNVVGDTFGDPSNFAFWGRNLAQTSGSSIGDGASWGVKNYTANPEAKISWDSQKTQSFRAKNVTLSGEGQDVTTGNIGGLTTWYLQGGPTITDSSQSDKAKYPEGKVWVVNGDLQISSSITYYGVGTVIVKNGNIIVDSGVSIKPDNENVDHLGIIVLK